MSLEAAGACLLASQAALRRLEACGRLPSLQVAGTRCFDRTLVDLLSEAAAGPSLTPGDLEGRIAARTVQVADWARFGYEPEAGAPQAATYDVPAAYVPPEDLPLPDIDLGVTVVPDTEQGSPAEPHPLLPKVVEAEGFKVIDEDDD